MTVMKEMTPAGKEAPGVNCRVLFGI